MKSLPGLRQILIIGMLICLLSISPIIEVNALPELEPEIRSPGIAAPIQGGRVLLPAMYLNMYNLSNCTPDLPRESNNVNDAPVICTGMTVSGWVHDADVDDVYKIWAVSGQRIVISMSGYGGDADLFLFPPGTGDVNVDIYAAWSRGFSNDELIEYPITETGYWYIDIWEAGGTTNYFVKTTLQ